MTGIHGGRRALFGASALVMSVAALASPTFAADATTGAAKASAAAGTALQEVVVTATRRSELLSRTPAAVTALNADALEKSGITDITSLQNVVPNLSVGDQFGVNRTFIRGIGMTSIDLGADGAVAFLQDGAIISRPAAQLAGFYDVEQVEVLRGPQGTLYGRGATAGAVNIVTKKPTDQLDGYVRVTYGDYNQVGVQAAIGGPLIADKLLVRAALNIDQRDGYGRNLYDNAPVDNRDAKGGRIALTWLASPTLKATLTTEIYNENDNNYAFHYFGPSVAPEAALPYNLVGGKSIYGYYAGLGEQPNLRNIYSATDPINRRDNFDTTATIDWRPGAFDLKSITSFHDFRRHNNDDLSVSDKSNGTIYGLNEYTEKSETISQEIVGTYDAKRWNLVFGGMYFHEKNFGSVYVPTYNLALVLDPTDQLSAAQRAAINNGEYLQQGTVYTDAYGVYAQGTYDILDNLKFTAGLRYSYEHKQGQGAFVFTALGVDLPTDQQKGWGAFTPKFNLEYQWTPSTMLYATVERGFKSGVINIGSLNPVIDPEYVWDYEGGVKFKAFQNRLNAAASVFYYDYTNLQVGFVNAQSVVETVNAASARNYGAELETHALLARNFTVDFYATYLNARFTNFLDANYRNGFAVESLAGHTLPNAPDFTTRLGATYDIPLEGRGNLSLHGEANYQSKVYFTEFNNQDAEQKGRVLFDASLLYTAPNDRITVELWGKNLTNRYVEANNIVAAALFGFVKVGSLLPPRTFGATIGYKF